ncbi:30S ribosomal protein S6e [Candidatus Micrarchaeota archaeon]|nr:30S ribosomal protein S6e [Candidatus Micrarchaeota archaeon]
MKVVISDPKTGKTYQTDVAKEQEAGLVGLKIGDLVEGAIVGANAYKLQITGGSDKEGFPMRRDVSGPRRIRALLSSGTGIQTSRKGERRIKSVRGNTISENIMQLNTKVTEYGEKSLDELFPLKQKEGKTNV